MLSVVLRRGVTSECQDAAKGGIGGLKEVDREGSCSNCNWDG